MAKGPVIEVVCKPKSQYCDVTTLASDGGTTWVNGNFSLFRLDGASLKEIVRTNGSHTDRNADLVVHGDRLIACGDSGVVRSQDEGATFEPYALPSGKVKLYIGCLALTPDGTLWAAGQTSEEGKGVVLHGKPDGKALVRAKGAVGGVSAIAATPDGVVVGDWDGRVWIVKGDNHTIEATSLEAGARIRVVCRLSSGTILALAQREEVAGGQTLHRSEDGGRSFAPIADKLLNREVLYTLREIPGGPLVAGGWGSILVSNDDGRTFVKLRHPGKSDAKYTTSLVQDGRLLLGGPHQPILSVTMGEAKAQPRPEKAEKKPLKVRSSNGYVGSGKFRAALEALFGPLKARSKAKPPSWLDEQLDLLPPKIAAEVYALYMLFATCKVPPLCGLREGGFCTIPAQFEMDEEAVREEEWFVKKADVAFVMHALEIFNDGGNPFILVAKDGVYAFYDDPYGYERIADDLGDFLQVLVALESAKRGATPVEKATKLLSAKIHPHAGKAGYSRFITRMLPGDAKVGKGTKAAATTKPRVDEPAAATKKKATAKMFECTEGGSKKFWEITLRGSSFTTRFGKIGTPGQSSTKTFASVDEARAESEKLVREKRKKGYVPR